MIVGFIIFVVITLYLMISIFMFELKVQKTQIINKGSVRKVKQKTVFLGIIAAMSPGITTILSFENGWELVLMGFILWTMLGVWSLMRGLSASIKRLEAKFPYDA